MGRAEAERTFGITTKHVSPDLPHCEATLRENLMGLLADHRVMLDSGMNIEVSQNPSNWQDAMAKVRLTPALPANKACSALPLCDRWGDSYSRNCGFVSRKVKLNDVLAHDSRHTLPCATRAAAKSTDVGPGCSMRAEMNSMWVEPVTYTSICQGALDLGEAPVDESADAIALQMDGDRVWPPRALASDDDASAVAALLETLNDKLSRIEPRVAQTNGVGMYMRAVAAVIGDAIPTRAQRQLLEVGIGIFARNPIAFHSARKRALHTAMACHMRGRTELGQQLERLGDMILKLQAIPSKGSGGVAQSID